MKKGWSIIQAFTVKIKVYRNNHKKKVVFVFEMADFDVMPNNTFRILDLI